MKKTSDFISFITQLFINIFFNTLYVQFSKTLDELQIPKRNSKINQQRKSLKPRTKCWIYASGNIAIQSKIPESWEENFQDLFNGNVKASEKDSKHQSTISHQILNESRIIHSNRSKACNTIEKQKTNLLKAMVWSQKHSCT